jgi:hypothetical protein
MMPMSAAMSSKHVCLLFKTKESLLAATIRSRAIPSTTFNQTKLGPSVLLALAATLDHSEVWVRAVATSPANSSGIARSLDTPLLRSPHPTPISVGEEKEVFSASPAGILTRSLAETLRRFALAVFLGKLCASPEMAPEPDFLCSSSFHASSPFRILTASPVHFH